MKSNGCSVRNALSLHARATASVPSARTVFVRVCIVVSSPCSVGNVDAKREALGEWIRTDVDTAIRVSNSLAAHVRIEAAVVRPREEVRAGHEYLRVRNSV